MSYDENDVRAAHGIAPDSPIGRLPDHGSFVVGASAVPVRPNLVEGDAQTYVARPTWDKATPEQVRAELDAFVAAGLRRGMVSGLAQVRVGAAAARVIGWDPAADGQMVIGQTEDGGWVKVDRVEVDLSAIDEELAPFPTAWGSQAIVSGPVHLTRALGAMLFGPDWVAQQVALEVWEGEGGALCQS